MKKFLLILILFLSFLYDPFNLAKGDKIYAKVPNKKIQYSGNLFTREKKYSKLTKKKEIITNIKGNAKVKLGDYTFYSHLIRIVGKKSKYVEIPYGFKMVNLKKKSILFGKKALYKSATETLNIDSQTSVVQFKKNTKMNRWLKLNQIDYEKHDVLICNKLKRYMKLQIIECPNQVKGNNFFGAFNGNKAFYLEKEKILNVVNNIEVNFKQYYFKGNSAVFFNKDKKALLTGPIKALAFRTQSNKLNKENEKKYYTSDKFLEAKKNAIIQLENKQFIEMVQQDKFSFLYGAQLFFSQNKKNKKEKNFLLTAQNKYMVISFKVTSYRKKKDAIFAHDKIISYNKVSYPQKKVYFIDQDIAFKSNNIYVNSGSDTNVHALGNIEGYSHASRFLFDANWSILNNDKSKIKLKSSISDKFLKKEICFSFLFIEKDLKTNCFKEYKISSDFISLYPLNKDNHIKGKINAKLANISRSSNMHFIAKVNWFQLKKPVAITIPMLLKLLTNDIEVLPKLNDVLKKHKKQQKGKSSWVSYNSKRSQFIAPGGFSLNSGSLNLGGSHSILNQKTQEMILSGPLQGNF